MNLPEAQRVDTSSTEPLDVLIIGAGVAGAYAAWRLKTGALAPGSQSGLPANPQDRRVAVLEASLRVGGRLESLPCPGAPELRAELGGMGFTSANTIMTALVDDVFGLAAEPFPRGGPNNLFYLRGERFTVSELLAGNDVPYRLAPNEKGKSPIQLVVDAVETQLPGAASFTPEEWREVQENFMFKGRHLRDIGFWNFLLMNMSPEAFAFAHDATGHFFEVSNWNCAQALPWFLGDGAATYRTLTRGYDGLPKQCFIEFLGAGGLHALGVRATSIAQNPDGTLSVGLDDGMGGPIVTKRLVLAVPGKALQDLTPSSIVLPEPVVQPRVKMVTGHKVMKIFLAFASPWWQGLGITDGSTSSDLPLGQCWYFSPKPGASSSNSLLMASYNDTLATTYWEGLEGTPAFENPPDANAHWVAQAPSQLMVEEVVRQLQIVHDMEVPAPYAATMKDWSYIPYGGAFYTWNVGADAATVESTMLHPDPSVPLHIVGSTYSSDQGWAEGALQTAERFAQEQAGLEKPPWLA